MAALRGVNGMSRTVLVTGGAGFIGSNFVHYWRKKYPDDRLLVLDALTYAGTVENLPTRANDDKFTFWYGNVKNGELVDTLMAETDVVVHFAAESHVTRSIYDNFLFFETDVLGTQVVANAVVKFRNRVKRFVHISTSEVYGTAEAPLMTETHPLNPLSPYAAAKAGADRLVYSYYKTYNIPAVILRPFNNYGPRQHLEKLVPRFITSVLLNEPLTVHGDGRAARDFIHAEDTCRAVELLIDADIERVRGEVFNVGTGRSLSITDIADRVTSLMDVPNHPREIVGDRPGQVFRHTAGAEKIKKVLGFEPGITFERGLRDTIAWYRENRKWWEPQMWMRHIPIITGAGKRELH
jgi:dTDP-glucose 4,6-dehydratase